MTSAQVTQRSIANSLAELMPVGANATSRSAPITRVAGTATITPNARSIHSRWVAASRRRIARKARTIATRNSAPTSAMIVDSAMPAIGRKSPK
jgi:glutamate-1-semialdehyde aminotransferase